MTSCERLPGICGILRKPAVAPSESARAIRLCFESLVCEFAWQPCFIIFVTGRFISRDLMGDQRDIQAKREAAAQARRIAAQLTGDGNRRHVLAFAAELEAQADALERRNAVRYRLRVRVSRVTRTDR